MKHPDDSIAASSLAEVGVCERRVYLKAKFGERTNRDRQARLDRGTDLHDKAFSQSRPDQPSASDRRCFIATAVYGPCAPETDALRKYRDRALLTSKGGRTLVAVYYKVSPMIASMCDRSPVLRRTLRKVLDQVVVWTKC